MTVTRETPRPTGHAMHALGVFALMRLLRAFLLSELFRDQPPRSGHLLGQPLVEKPRAMPTGPANRLPVGVEPATGTGDRAPQPATGAATGSTRTGDRYRRPGRRSTSEHNSHVHVTSPPYRNLPKKSGTHTTVDIPEGLRGRGLAGRIPRRAGPTRLIWTTSRASVPSTRVMCGKDTSRHTS